MTAAAYVIPIAVLTLTGLGVLVFFCRRGEPGAGRAALATGAGTAFALISLAWARAQAGNGEDFGGMLLGDALGVHASILILLAGLATLPLLLASLRKTGHEHGEIFALLPFCMAGMMVMMMTNHLVVFFLGLETMSLALYILAGSLRGDGRSLEAGMKYLLTGAFATGVLLMGMAFLFGVTGSFHLRDIAAWLIQNPAAAGADPGGLGILAGAGILMMLAGIAFKLGVVPFHQWAPDVYDGAPTPLAGFMATTVKVAVFVALIRIAAAYGMVRSPHFTATLAVLASLTVLAGGLGALAQSSVKRMLAWSSLGHGGYVLMAVAGAAAAMQTVDPVPVFILHVEAVFGYLVAYVVMTLGAFAVLSELETRERTGLQYADLAGLRDREPALAASMLIFVLSLAGIPLTVGFLAKFGVFKSLLAIADPFSGQKWAMLAVLGLGSVVGLAYYLKVVVMMYMRPSPGGAVRPSAASFVVLAVIVLCAALTLWLGFGPNLFGVGAEGLTGWARVAAHRG